MTTARAPSRSLPYSGRLLSEVAHTAQRKTFEHDTFDARKKTGVYCLRDFRMHAKQFCHSPQLAHVAFTPDQCSWSKEQSSCKQAVLPKHYLFVLLLLLLSSKLPRSGYARLSAVVLGTGPGFAFAVRKTSAPKVSREPGIRNGASSRCTASRPISQQPYEMVGSGRRRTCGSTGVPVHRLATAAYLVTSPASCCFWNGAAAVAAALHSGAVTCLLGSLVFK